MQRLCIVRNFQVPGYRNVRVWCEGAGIAEGAETRYEMRCRRLLVGIVLRLLAAYPAFFL